MKGARKAWPQWKKRQVWFALREAGVQIERWGDGTWHYAPQGGPWWGQGYASWGEAATAALAASQVTR
jgi:hypothetical protein